MSDPGAEVKLIAVPAVAAEEDFANLILLASTLIT